jgi:hypothetical protein
VDGFGLFYGYVARFLVGGLLEHKFRDLLTRAAKG